MDVRLVILPNNVKHISDEIYERSLQHIDFVEQARVKRFYKREDAWRSLIGMLLPRKVLSEHGVSITVAKFGRTEARKPYVDCPSLSGVFGYNVTHDNFLVAIASQIGATEDARKIGVDVMKQELPRNETFRSFLHSIGDTLTEGEIALFRPGLDSETAIRYIFQLWTFKEAYTKAVGLGLGFDFKRIHFDVSTREVLVDGDIPRGWEFTLFEVKNGEEIYRGTVARWAGGDEMRVVAIPDIAEESIFHIQGFEELIDVEYK
ncbi:hypothetical protein M422DRAFT_197492 [Sphaerobolus stellatus SS14]|nr:hypothetical protein M422DRAFT_197492 [Sphaerobolus stellatus SS14]